jgi:hypothetical protein
MTWIKVDDHFADHPKVMALGPDRLPGLGLWQVAASYCARYLTDGFVPAAHVKAHAPRKLVNRLVAVGLFDVVEGGYVLHDWLRYNPSRQQVEEAQAKKRAAGQAGGRASGQARAQAPATAEHEAKTKPVPVPVPVPVSGVLSSVLGNGGEEWVEPRQLYATRARRRSLSKKELDWLEDLHARFSRGELVAALRAIEPGPDYLKRVDAYLEHGSAAA